MGTIFVVAASSKLLDPKQFAQRIGDFGLAFDALVEPTAWAIVGAELIIGIALVFRRRGSLAAASGILLLFVGVLTYGTALGLDIEGGYQLISTNELTQMLDADEEFLLIDAMPAVDSFAKGHIPRAVNFTFPIEVMDEWSDNVMGGRKQEEFQQMLGEALDRKIVVYCGFVKCARSHNAAICARELGFTNVYRYPGGIYAWRGSGYALTTD